MNLPFILDIAIGLIFVYLMISLLASEIQELIATVLQWRAEHLKKSIEVLIGGGANTPEAHQARSLANKLYTHPLIKNLNQEAKGLLAQGARKVGRTVFTAYEQVTHKENLFADRKTGPSYIPPASFADTLMDTLEIQNISRILTHSRLEEFKQQHLKDIISIIKNSNLSESSKELIDIELRKFSEEIDEIIKDYQQKYISLNFCLELLEARLTSLMEGLKLSFSSPMQSEEETFIQRIQLLNKNVYGDVGRRLLVNELKPSLSDIVDLLRRQKAVYDELEKAVKDKNSPTYKGIQSLINSLPDSLKESLGVLAKRVQNKGEGVNDEMNQLHNEIEVWFDRSMERASGVYKRNARGVAILIGFLLAVIANADSFHIISSLSKDSVLRNTVSIYADNLVRNNPSVEVGDLEKVQREVRQSLEDISLPIGWSVTNLEQQDRQNQGWPIPYLKRILGWTISALAISMGASFWFDLLSKVVNVRNAGKRSFPSEDRGSTSE